jgi:uracil-DNA glycosylase
MNLFKNVHESWIPLLHSLAYKEPLMSFLDSLSKISFQPQLTQIFRVFEMPVQDIKVVILGQEPYSMPQVSNGLAYAAQKGMATPKLLLKIDEELSSQGPAEVMYMEDFQTLEHLEEQGVFLFNTALTVATGSAGSHYNHWRKFTETVVSFISNECPCIWLLWGANPLSYSIKISNPLLVKGYDEKTIKEIPTDVKLNYVIPGSHPAATFFEKAEGSFSNHGFNYANVILAKKSLKQIIW